MLITSVVLAATKVRLPLVPSGATVSLSYCTNFAALALFSPFEATFIIAVSVWSQCVLNNAGRTAIYRTVFSIANIVVAAAVANATAGLVGGLSVGRGLDGARRPHARRRDGVLLLQHADARRGGGARIEEVAGDAVDGAVPVERARLLRRRGHGHRRAAYLIATASTLRGVRRHSRWSCSTGATAPTSASSNARQAMHMATVEALARAIGARDQTLEASKTVSDTHVRRVQRLAVSLARRAGMSEDEVKGVEVAALLHDIGKLAVPEHILNKPGKLTPEERKLIQTHPAVGAEIIGAVDFGYPVAPLIASHHERWNGEGYPKGLRGDEIPLGSRILGIVDYFDALHRRPSVSQGQVRGRGAPDDQGRARRRRSTRGSSRCSSRSSRRRCR